MSVTDYCMTVQELQKQWLPKIAPEDFFLLLVHATRKEKVFLLAHPEYELTTEEDEKVEQYLKRRLKHEPLAYIVGHKEFYGREFHVTPDTLIPRPETELMVEQALKQLTKNYQQSTENKIDVIDIGTGSGNIIITLVKEVEKIHEAPSIQFYGLDISPAALTIAMKNAEHHNRTNKILFLESDLLQNFPRTHDADRHLIITANLPYLSDDIYHESDATVRDYEPRSALLSGHDGLDHYARLLEEIRELSCHYTSTVFLLEISPEQTPVLTEKIKKVFPRATLLTLQDLSGRDRLIQATL